MLLVRLIAEPAKVVNAPVMEFADPCGTSVPWLFMALLIVVELRVRDFPAALVSVPGPLKVVLGTVNVPTEAFEKGMPRLTVTPVNERVDPAPLTEPPFKLNVPPWTAILWPEPIEMVPVFVKEVDCVRLKSPPVTAIEPLFVETALVVSVNPLGAVMEMEPAFVMAALR